MKKTNPTDRKPKVDNNDGSTYQGAIPSIVGRRRLLVRASGKEGFLYVDDNAKSIEAVKARYGNDFIRVLPVVTVEHKPSL